MSLGFFVCTRKKLFLQTSERKINMTFFKLLFNTGVILTVATAKSTNEYLEKYLFNASDYRLPTEAIPRHYNIMLTQRENKFVGESIIDIEIVRKTAIVAFHAQNLNIQLKTIQFFKHGKRSRYMLHIIKMEVKWKEFYYYGESQIFVLEFHEELLPGNYTLNMKYEIPLQSNQGFVKTKNVNTIFSIK